MFSRLMRNPAQCSAGFVRGLIMATTAMLAKPREKPLTITEIRRGLAGNLCRCTGYQMIVNTVLDCEKTK